MVTMGSEACNPAQWEEGGLPPKEAIAQVASIYLQSRIDSKGKPRNERGAFFKALATLKQRMGVGQSGTIPQGVYEALVKEAATVEAFPLHPGANVSAQAGATLAAPTSATDGGTGCGGARPAGSKLKEADGVFQCPTCQCILKNAQRLQTHLRRIHAADTRKRPDLQTVINKHHYDAPRRGQEARSRHADHRLTEQEKRVMLRRMRERIPNSIRLNACPLCAESSGNWRGLVKHVLRAHGKWAQGEFLVLVEDEVAQEPQRLAAMERHIARYGRAYRSSWGRIMSTAPTGEFVQIIPSGRFEMNRRRH